MLSIDFGGYGGPLSLVLESEFQSLIIKGQIKLLNRSLKERNKTVKKTKLKGGNGGLFFQTCPITQGRI